MNQGFVNNVISRQNSRKAKVIKRYGNRKLYDTERSSYVVLNDIAKMIRNREEVQIIDNETKSDITSATLTQIIFGAEKKSSLSAPLNILKAIIQRGDGSLSNYLAEIGLYKTKLDGRVILENPKKHTKPTPRYTLPESNSFPYKTIQERVAQAALTQDPSNNDSPILPTSKNPSLKK